MSSSTAATVAASPVLFSANAGIVRVPTTLRSRLRLPGNCVCSWYQTLAR
ncbi:hypothetical protein SAXI111661_11830 [Saccharomonospora xinjiangensis]